MTYVAYELNLGHGFKLTVKSDNFHFYDPQGDLKITYALNSSRILGNQPVSADEENQLLDQSERGKIIALSVYGSIDSDDFGISESSFIGDGYKGRTGIAYVTKEFAIKQWGNKKITQKVKEKANEYIKNGIKYFNDILQGNAWQYSIVHNGEVLCLYDGWIGESEYCLRHGLMVAKGKFRARGLKCSFDIDKAIEELCEKPYSSVIEREMKIPSSSWLERLESQSAFF